VNVQNSSEQENTNILTKNVNDSFQTNLVPGQIY